LKQRIGAVLVASSRVLLKLANNAKKLTEKQLRSLSVILHQLIATDKDYYQVSTPFQFCIQSP